jgi:transcriptional regulator with XRE-family HTH domain
MTAESDLRKAVRPIEITAALELFGLNRPDIAAVVQVSAETVSEWEADRIRTDQYERLTDLRDLVVLLTDSLTARGAGQWLQARNRLLDDARPLDALGRGEWSRTRRAAMAFIDGSYA